MLDFYQYFLINMYSSFLQTLFFKLNVFKRLLLSSRGKRKIWKDSLSMLPIENLNNINQHKFMQRRYKHCFFFKTTS